MQPIRSILIVGGGTAGWLSAAYLSQATRNKLDIRVVDSAEIGRVGVGEATVPTLGHTLRFLGLAERDWMPDIGATYKLAIRFDDWLHGPTQPSTYWHPFSRPMRFAALGDVPFFPEMGHGLSELEFATRERHESGKPVAESLSEAPRACSLKRSPHHANGTSLPTAYHIDALRFADLLRARALARGVKHIDGTVVDVVCRQGSVEAVRTSEDEFRADLYIDCTGFRSVLLSALGEPFLSDEQYLLCDRAVAFARKHTWKAGELPPYTVARALKHGWSWNIPLQHRTGHGYVFSSRATDDAAAIAELAASLDIDPNDVGARVLPMRVGRSERAWVGNCVGIGLSAAFLEPLESTGIFLVEFALAALLNNFPSLEGDASARARFNETFAEFYEEIRDFIVLHYVLSQRDDTEFWREARGVRVPDSLAKKMMIFRKRLPDVDAMKLRLFRAFSYACILDGYGELPPASPLVDLWPDVRRSALSSSVESLPDHLEYLRTLDHH